MNILIESGATKSTCIGFHGVCTFFTYKTTGINATYATKEAIKAIFQEIIVKNNIEVNNIEKIRFYGAGCYNLNNAEKVKEVLCTLFPNTNISVFSDLYAACHALCKKESGFVAILGTGAASCLYNGEQIVDKAPSLGYLLGDEGSGTHLGKRFVTLYLKDQIDSRIAHDFEKTFLVNKQLVFEKVYQQANPQTFFASIPVFLHKYLKNNQVKTIIQDSFQEFFTQQKNYYTTFSYSWNFCGSIAYYFQDILKDIAAKNKVNIGNIIIECAPYLIGEKN